MSGLRELMDAPVLGAPRAGNVLFVDDEAFLRNVGSLALARAGFEVVCAADGNEAEAILAAQATTFDLAIADWCLPGLSGRDLVARIRASHPGIPVIVSSGMAPASIRRDLSGHDGIVVLAKPWTLKDLLSTVDRITVERG